MSDQPLAPRAATGGTTGSPALFLSCKSGSRAIDYQWRFYPDFSEPKAKALRRARRLRGTDGDGVRELLGRDNAKTTMAYTHVLNRAGKGVRSPPDSLKSSSGNGSYSDPHKTPG